ncbi:hypothetical protein F2Q68_00005888 [Brassica cretica]|uniref:Protein FAR1-RELATED SEQUENCE n=2 Tax=Brassica cretica TaxID=69181 RepID=A0ABQ7BYA6_BRACR|nr:hypothetical protein F2Q68_00005888 [Brassica cretica]KAF3544519.1 hypothetical protein DY000_02009060 [Brassica cretica]
MVSASIYLIQDESSFIEREENYEIYQEIYSDPIYDVYEDDLRIVDFIFNEDSFANLVCAKIVQHEIHGKFVHDEFRANFGQGQKIWLCAKFGFENNFFKDFSYKKPIQDSRTNLF